MSEWVLNDGSGLATTNPIRVEIDGDPGIMSVHLIRHDGALALKIQSHRIIMIDEDQAELLRERVNVLASTRPVDQRIAE